MIVRFPHTCRITSVAAVSLPILYIDGILSTYARARPIYRDRLICTTTYLVRSAPAARAFSRGPVPWDGKEIGTKDKRERETQVK